MASVVGDVFVTDIDSYNRVIYGRNSDNEPIAIKVNYDNRSECLIWVFDQSRFNLFLTTFKQHVHDNGKVFINNDSITWCGSKGFEFADNFDEEGNVADMPKGIPHRLSINGESNYKNSIILKFIKTECFAYGFEVVLCSSKEFIIMNILASLMEHVTDAEQIKNLKVIGTWIKYRVNPNTISILNRDTSDVQLVNNLKGVNNYYCWSPSDYTEIPKYTYLFFDIEAGSRWELDLTAPIHSNGCLNQIIQMVSILVSQYDEEEQAYVDSTMVIVNLEESEFDYSEYDSNKYCFVKNQLELIDMFMNCLCQADVIGGHNIIGYDARTILTWMLLLKSPWKVLYEDKFKSLSVDSIEKWEINLPWQLTIDSMLYFQNFVRSDCNNLNYLGEKYLDDRKHDLGYEQMMKLMFSFYHEQDAKALQTVIDYCIQDTQLSWDLVKTKIDMFSAFVYSCHLSLTSYMMTNSSVPHAQTSSIITAFLLGCPFSTRFQTGTNSIQSLVVEKPKDTYIGGHVFTPKNSLVIGKQIQILDINSLYPSAAMEGNYGGPTCWAIGEREWEMYLQTVPSKLKDNIKLLKRQGIVYVSVKTYNENQFGILKRLQIYFMTQRAAAKREMKKYTIGSQLYNFFDAQQLARKLVSNGSYGLYAREHKKYNVGLFKLSSGGTCFLKNIDSAACITTRGQDLIKMITEFVGENYGQVTYGDTDSIFVIADEPKLDSIINQYMEEYTNTKYIVFENEGWYNVLIQSSSKGKDELAKKRYILGNVLTDKLKITGIEKKNYMMEKEFRHICLNICKTLYHQGVEATRQYISMRLVEYCKANITNPHEMSTFKKVRIVENLNTLIRSCMYYLRAADFDTVQMIQHVHVAVHGKPAEVPVKFYNNQDPLYPFLYISTLVKLLNSIGITDKWCEGVYNNIVLNSFVSERKKLLQTYPIEFVNTCHSLETGCYFDKAIIASNYSSQLFGGDNYATCCQSLTKSQVIEVVPESWESVKIQTPLRIYNVGEEEPVKELGISLLRSMYCVKSVCIISTKMKNEMLQLYYIHQLLLLNKCAKSANSLKQFFAKRYVECVAVETPIGFLFTNKNHIVLFKSINELLNYLDVNWKLKQDE